MQKYTLDSKKALDYFERHLKSVNKLSDLAISTLNINSGQFFALLPEGTAIEEVHEFDIGGKATQSRDFVGAFLESLLKSNKALSCIFDDFNADLKDGEKNDLYQSNGFHYKSEVYYSIREPFNYDIIKKCLRYSNAIWHSLCIITEFKLNKKNKDVTENELKLICESAVLVIIGAYDAESYVVWEKL